LLSFGSAGGHFAKYWCDNLSPLWITEMIETTSSTSVKRITFRMCEDDIPGLDIDLHAWKNVTDQLMTGGFDKLETVLGKA